MVLRHALDHLLDEDGLADTGATEEADLSTLHVGREEVDRLDARLEHLGLGLELVEARRLAVDAPALGDLDRLAGSRVEHLAGDVEDLALGDVADGDRDRAAGVAHLLAADHAVGRLERDGADEVVTEVLRDLEGDLGRVVTDGDRGLQRVVDLGDRVVRELDVDDGPGDTRDAADDSRVGLLGGEAHGFFSPWELTCRMTEHRRRRRSRRSAA